MFSHQHRVVCLFGAWVTSCALPKMNADYDPEGVAGAAAQGTAGSSDHGGSPEPTQGGVGQAGSFALAGGSVTRDTSMGGLGGTALAAGGGAVSLSGGSSMGAVAIAAGTSSYGGIPTAGGDSAILAGGSAIGGNAAGGTLGIAGTPASSGMANIAGTSANAGGTTGIAGESSTGGTTGIAGMPSTGGTTGIAGESSTGGTTGIAGMPSAGGAAGIAGMSITGGGTLGIAGTTNIAGTSGASGELAATAIATGSVHSCALLSDGSVRCWGSNCYGQLGNAVASPNCNTETLFSSTPVKVEGIENATALAAGWHHTCAIVEGKVHCWGRNLYGQLGMASTTNASSVAVLVPGIATAKAVTAGEMHSCALLEDGTVQCWGGNLSSSRQLGTGNTSVSEMPAPDSVVIDTLEPATKLSTVTKIATRARHTCATTAAGKVFCWGDNILRQLGNPDTSQFSAIALEASLLSTGFPSLSASAIGAGSGHSCALMSDEAIRCWGSGDLGKLGDGNAKSSPSPVTVAFDPNSTTASDLALGNDHACAIISDSRRTVQCWGYNYRGQLGDGTTETRNAPVRVMAGTIGNTTPLERAQSIAAGYSHSCAIVEGGLVYCWGLNQSGQLGTGDTNPSTVATPTAKF